MARHNEATDGVENTRVATGIHAVAAAILCSHGATQDELELAKRVLLRDPPRALPRESEGSAETFNRQMDAAIESCNASAGESTRAVRRSRLAKDLDRADLVLVDRNFLAGLIADRLNLELREHNGGYSLEEESLGAELATSDELGAVDAAISAALTHTPALEVCAASTSCGVATTIAVSAPATTSDWRGGADPLQSVVND